VARPALSDTASTASATSSLPASFRLRVASPIGMATDGHTVWAVSAADGALQPISLTGKLGRRIPVGDTPLRATVSGDRLWVTAFRAGQLIGVSRQSGKAVARVSVPGGPEGVAAGFGAIWVVRQDVSRLTEVAPSGRRLPDIPLGNEPRQVAVTARDAFVTNTGDGTVTRVDPRSGATTTSRQVCGGAQGIAPAGHLLWITCTSSDEVVTVDQTTLRPVGRINLDGEPDAVHIVDGKAVVLLAKGPTLVELTDPARPREVRRRALGDAPPLLDQANVDFAVAGGRYWVSSYLDSQVISARW
jgi:sugar lactone lactonase YvrE